MSYSISEKSKYVYFSETINNKRKTTGEADAIVFRGMNLAGYLMLIKIKLNIFWKNR